MSPYLIVQFVISVWLMQRLISTYRKNLTITTGRSPLRKQPQPSCEDVVKGFEKGSDDKGSTILRMHVKTSSIETTRDTVIQFLCQDGKVVTTDRSLLLCFSPFLRSVICSAPSTTSLVMSLPDASSSGLEDVLSMIGQAWMEDIYVLTEEQFGVVKTLGIPVGGDVEKVQIVEFGGNNVQAGIDSVPQNLVTESSEPKQDDIRPTSGSTSLKCIQCEMDFGEVSEDSKDELSIHIGEIHSEVELLAEFYKIFPAGSNICRECGYKVSGEYVQKEHIILHHPWPLLRCTVEELCRPAACGASVGILENNVVYDEKAKETNQKEVSKVKKTVLKSPLLEKQLPPKDADDHANANSKPSDVDNNKAKKSKRGRKRKCGLETSESPKSSLVFPYVPQRKSAKKASLFITKVLTGEKRYKQQDIGMFVKKVEKNTENKVESGLINSKLNDTSELMEDIDKLLKDSDDDEEETLGLEISYANSEIEGIQDYIEFSDSDSDDKNDEDVLNYSIKVENKSLTENDKVNKDLLEIQNGIMYSDSEDED